MAVVPDSHDFIAGVATTSEMNTYVRDPIRFALNPPLAELRQTVVQSIPNGTGTPITWDVEDWDKNPAGTPQHDNVTNNSRFTAVFAGIYELGGAGGFAANVTGQRVTAWIINGSTVNGSQVSDQALGALGNKVAARSKLVFLNVGDYVELTLFQNSGGPLNTNVTSNEQSSAMIRWVSN